MMNQLSLSRHAALVIGALFEAAANGPCRQYKQFDLICRKIVGKVAMESFEGQRETIAAIGLISGAPGRDIDKTMDLRLVARLSDHRNARRAIPLRPASTSSASELNGQCDATTENPFARMRGTSLAQQPALANAP